MSPFFRGMAAAALAAAAMAGAHAQQAGGQVRQATASGEVRRLDAADGKVAIKHEAISALRLPAMTLVYQADPKLLAGLKPGDRVRFTAQRRDGQYVVTEIAK